MRRYIDVDLLKDKTTRVNNIWNGTTNAEGKGLDEIIDDIPTADVVSREGYDQIKWERDTAIAQLEELGYGLGEELRHE